MGNRNIDPRRLGRPERDEVRPAPRARDTLTDFLGDTPGRTVVKLLVLSLIVGIIMSAIGFMPIDVWYAFTGFVERLLNLGFDAFGRFGEYLLYGAMVVVPVFLFLRLMKTR